MGPKGTKWDQVGTKWDQIGTKCEPNEIKWGPNGDQMGQSGDQVGTKQGPKGTKWGPTAKMLIFYWFQKVFWDTKTKNVDFSLVLEGFWGYQNLKS